MVWAKQERPGYTMRLFPNPDWAREWSGQRQEDARVWATMVRSSAGHASLNTRGISFLFFSNYKAPHKRWLPGSLSGLPLHCNSLCLAAKRSRCQRNKAKSWIPNSRKQKWPSKGGKAGSWQGLGATKSSRPHFFTSEAVPVLKETTAQARDKHSKERSQEKYRNSHRRLSTSPFKKLRSRNSLETSWSTKTTLGKQNITIDNKLPYQ